MSREEELTSAAIPAEVLDNLLEGCQVVGPDWRYVYVNDIAAAHGRTTREALVGRTMMECYPGIEASPMFAALRRCMSERAHHRMESEFVHPDGTLGWFDLRFIPVPQGVAILSLDITDRLHRLAAIVNDSDDAIIATTLDGVVTSWNRGAERILGYAAGEMIGKSVTVLEPDARRADERPILERLARGERIHHFEGRRRRKDGEEIDVSITLSPIRDATGRATGISAIARDITQIKRMQAQLVAAKEATEAANRELEAFSYSVAHDLRAPLRHIQAYLAMLVKSFDGPLPPEAARCKEVLDRTTRNMAVLIDDLLAFSRMKREELRESRIDLAALVRESIHGLELATRDRAIDWKIGPLPEVVGDPAMVKQVVANLLDNAVKYSRPRPTARIEVGCAGEQDGRTVVFVRDNGVGFDMEYADKLFGVFERLHSHDQFEGTGIGLANVRSIIERHGGRVWAESAPGEGAAFYFTLRAIRPE